GPEARVFGVIVRLERDGEPSSRIGEQAEQHADQVFQRQLHPHAQGGRYQRQSVDQLRFTGREDYAGLRAPAAGDQEYFAARMLAASQLYEVTDVPQHRVVVRDVAGAQPDVQTGAASVRAVNGDARLGQPTGGSR